MTSQLVSPPRARRSIIILEGTETVGKTSVARVLQALVPYHLMLKLSGPQTLVGSSRLGYLANMFRASTALLAHASDNNAILDRFTMSERVYGQLNHGFVAQDYWVFDELEEALARQNAYQVLLIADEASLSARLARKYDESPNEDHGKLENLLAIQEKYLVVSQQETNFDQAHNLIVNTSDRSPEQVAHEILRLVGLADLVPKG